MRFLFLVLVVLALVFTNSAQAGCVGGDCQNGQGAYLYTDDVNFVYYTGEFKNGAPDGQGTMKRAEGNYICEYTGGFKNGKYDGRGVLTDSFGQRFEGRFKNGKYLGK